MHWKESPAFATHYQSPRGESVPSSINHIIIHNEQVTQSEKYHQKKQKFARCHNNHDDTLSSMSVLTSASDPDWIRNPDTDSGG